METNFTISFDQNQIDDLLQQFAQSQQNNSAIATASSSEAPAPKSSKNIPKLLSIQEMCELFKVSRVTINTWMKQGKIPFLKISRRVYFKLDEIFERMPVYNLATVNNFQKSVKNRRINDRMY